MMIILFLLKGDKLMKKKIISLVLSLIMIYSLPINSFAQSGLNFHVLSTKYTILEEKNGVYLVENIEINGEKYIFTHSKENGKNIIDISGAENERLEFDINGKLLKSSTSNIFMKSSSDWQYFEPTTYTVSWKQGATAAVIAGAMAGAVGGPASAFLGGAAALAGVSIGCSIKYSGRYKLEGSHVRAEYTAKIYHGNEHIYTSTWGAYR